MLFEVAGNLFHLSRRIKEAKMTVLSSDRRKPFHPEMLGFTQAAARLPTGRGSQ
jgi:hypothetical protein